MTRALFLARLEVACRVEGRLYVVGPLPELTESNPVEDAVAHRLVAEAAFRGGSGTHGFHYTYRHKKILGARMGFEY
jgi:hypothetical protein